MEGGGESVGFGAGHGDGDGDVVVNMASPNVYIPEEQTTAEEAKSAQFSRSQLFASTFP